MQSGASARRIVVGVDGSEHSARVLDWAVGEATLRRVELDVVSCAYVPRFGIRATALDGYDERIMAESAREGLSEVVARSRLREHPDLVWHEHVRYGAPAGVLLHESERAELLVVGARGAGGFAGLLLGSVAQQVATHSRCPVVIVR